MTLLADVAERVRTSVPALADRVEFVADMAALVSEGALPQKELMAYVVPLGFDDHGGETVAGLHTQMLKQSIGVILCAKALGDARARRALPTIDTVKDQVIAAVAGWAPVDVAGVFSVTKGRLVSVTKGLVIYQLDFAVTDQLRITR